MTNQRPRKETLVSNLDRVLTLANDHPPPEKHVLLHQQVFILI